MRFSLLTSWTFDPAVILAALAQLGAYLAVMLPALRRADPDRPASPWRVVAYVSGIALLTVTLLSPLDELGRRYLMLGRTAQVMLIVTVVAPLLLIGLPEWLVHRLIPVREWREASESIMFSVVAVLGFNALVLFWHIPKYYDLAARDTVWHDVSSLSFLVAGILTWWPVLTPTNHRIRLSAPFQMFYLALESLPLGIFGVTLIFAPSAIYSVYTAAPRLTVLSARVDQQVAGGILAVPRNLLDIVLLSLVFFAWINGIERAQRAREGAEFAGAGAAGTEVTPASPEVAAEVTRPDGA